MDFGKKLCNKLTILAMYADLCFCWFHNNILLEWNLVCN